MFQNRFGIALLLILSSASMASASICQEVQKRIGKEAALHHFVQGSTTPALTHWRPSESNPLVYEITSGGEMSSLQMKDYGLMCLFKSAPSAKAFSAGHTFAFSIPNEKGECWVYVARISRLVPEDRTADFILRGFCVSPFSWNPETSWHGTSALTPVTSNDSP